MGSTSSEPSGAVIDGVPCAQGRRPAVPCPAGTGWPEGLPRAGIKAVAAPEPCSQAGSAILRDGWGQPGAALPRSCPAFGRDMAGIWQGFGRDLGCSRHSHSLRLLPKALLSSPFPSLPAPGFTDGIFDLLLFVPHSVGKGRQSPEGTACRESSRSILTLPGPLWQ